MRYYYFDASVLVKAYIWEVGTEDVRQVLETMRTVPPQTRIVTSRLAFLEVASAISRRRAAGEFTEEQANEIRERLRDDFGNDLLPFTVVESRPGLVNRAAELTREHRLRALDALHLATGIAARRRAPPGASFRFASADRRLNAAALAEFLDVFDPRSPIPPGASTPLAPDE